MIQTNILFDAVYLTNVKGFGEPYRGKVRDVYTLNENTIAIVATDRISAFDVILDKPIPFKGQILNTLSKYFFDNVSDILPTHIIDVPHPNVTIAKKCTPIPIEIVVRGYLAGHAWRTYKSGERHLCGVKLPDGLKMNQKFESPIITPTTKAIEGHDEDISRENILKQKIVPEEIYTQVENFALKLFERGTELAQQKELILVDTKYEFGIYNGEIHIMDEVHTPDSSRYFYASEYSDAFEKGLPQKQLSKEFVREWLMSRGFDGKTGQPSSLPDEFRLEVFEKYKHLFAILTQKEFNPVSTKGLDSQLADIFSQY